MFSIFFFKVRIFIFLTRISVGALPVHGSELCATQTDIKFPSFYCRVYFRIIFSFGFAD